MDSSASRASEPSALRSGGAPEKSGGGRSAASSPGHNSDTVAARQLRAFIERVERLEEEIRTLNDDKKEVYAEARGNGFDVKAMKAIIRLRRMDQAAREEEEAMLDLYKAALGMV
jgi:uncharacterized protein (UPF0335 family)